MKVRLPKANKSNGMENFQQIAQKTQEEMETVTRQLEEKLYTATSGGGAVLVTINGKPEVVEIKIEKEALDPNDPEILADMLIAGINEAINKSIDERNFEMQKISSKLPIPGMF
jgi:DNA-binding YbaB/EbfC family protein